MKRILCIDGGGAKGLIACTVLKHIEKTVGKQIHEIFDMILGSSVGGIIAGTLASGKITAATLSSILYNELPNIFKFRLRVPILQPKCNPEYKKKVFEEHLSGMTMSDCLTKFICTSINLVDGRTHFFKSWEEKDGRIPLINALMRTSAAPLYFGTIVDDKEHGVWMDGACGDYSSPAMFGLMEILLQGWLKDGPVHILSLGCGQSFKGAPFDQAKKYRNIRQILYFSSIEDGGLARLQVSRSQDFQIETIANQFEGLSFQRLETYDMPKEMDCMAGIKYLSNYIQIGEEFATKVDYGPLQKS